MNTDFMTQKGKQLAGDPEPKASDRLSQSIDGPRSFGMLIILVCFFGLGGWAAVAPLSSAAIAIGQVSPDGSQRTIQHLEGGIIRDMSIKEGDHVSEGQRLIVLDTALAEANYQSRFRKLQRLRVVKDRLVAQQGKEKDFSLDVVEEMLSDPTFVQFVKNESATFYIKLKLIDEQVSIYEHQEQQILKEIESLEAQVAGLRAQVTFLDKEIEAKERLLKKGLTRAPELYALQRKRAELDSEANAIVSTIARAHQKNQEVSISKVTFETESFEKIAEQLAQINTEISQAEEAFRAAEDVLKRTDITSPINGRVLKLHYKTLGGVVRPGEPIMVIVPEDEELIVEARLMPSDIDNVSLGMKASVQFSSFMARHMAPLDGEVITLGADVVTDSKTGEAYYPLRISVVAPAFSEETRQIDLRPGMPAEVFVQTGTHTPMQYIFGPVLKSFNKAFREEPA
jgi:membrane fusion protein, type I secretion system